MEPGRTDASVSEVRSARFLRTAPELTTLAAGQIARLVDAQELSAEEVTAAHLGHIADVDPQLHALVAVDAEHALDTARAVDRQRRRGHRVGALAGVPFVVKDNFDVRRQHTSSGSRAHANVVAMRHAAAVGRIVDAGGVLLGRANMDELALGASTQTSAFGATRNPWDVRRSPGGSSGGSAAAVASGMAALSVGSDTGGSIREPASQCGIVGMAPSPGLVAVDGLVPFAPALDRVGPLARSVADAALLLSVLCGRADLAQVAHPSNLGRVRVGVIGELAEIPNQPGVLTRLAVTRAVLAEIGADLVTVSVPDAGGALDAYMKITSAACVPIVEPYVRTGQAGDEVVRRHAIGRALLRDSPELLDAACDTQRRLVAQTQDALRGCDVLLSPTMPSTAPFLEGQAGERGPSAEELSDPMAAPYTDCWTVVANLADLASLSVPAGCSPDDAMPVGMMLSGLPGSDGRLLALAAALEARGLAER